MRRTPTMNDEFLHRLRKEPRREFAARLQAHLRQQSTRAFRPKDPARARTLLTLLLLGGTAFAVTFAVMRGLPASFRELYQHAAARSGLTPVATPAVTARSGATSSAGSPTGPSPRGALGSRIQQISAVSSWAAYPYAAAITDHLNGTTDTAGAPIAPHIDLSRMDGARWPGPICSGAEIAYAFEPVATVSQRPCAPDVSGHPSRIVAIPVGYEAVALARSPLYGELDLTRRQVFLALAKWVPDPARAGTVRENPNASWRQLDARLGPGPIEFMGPPLSSAAGRSIIELLMEAGCDTYPWIAALKSSDPSRYARICRTVRTDGVYVEVPEGDTSALLAEPNAVGIIGLNWIVGRQSFQHRSVAQIQLNGLVISRLDGVEPTPRGIESGTYPGSRGFYLYVDRGRVAPNVVIRLVRSEFRYYPEWGALLPPPRPELQAAYAEALRP
jgi:phosphate transport system substrate-binding protein